MGAGFTCVLLTRGRVRCWGLPSRELDVGTNVTVDAVFGSGVYYFFESLRFWNREAKEGGDGLCWHKKQER